MRINNLFFPCIPINLMVLDPVASFKACSDSCINFCSVVSEFHSLISTSPFSVSTCHSSISSSHINMASD